MSEDFLVRDDYISPAQADGLEKWFCWPILGGPGYWVWDAAMGDDNSNFSSSETAYRAVREYQDAQSRSESRCGGPDVSSKKGTPVIVRGERREPPVEWSL